MQGGQAGRWRTWRRWRALAAGVGLLGAAAGSSAAACLADLPPAESADGDGGGGQDAALDAAPARCGDGIVQRSAGEQCDPGAQDAATTCVGCQIVCPEGGFVSANGHCYFTVEDGARLKQGEAVSRCASQSAHVVTFDGTGEESYVDGQLGDGGPYWLALTVDMLVNLKPVYDVGTINEPGWRSTCPGCPGTPIPPTAASFLNPCKSYEPGACVTHTPETAGYLGIGCDGVCTDAGTDAGMLIHAVCEREPVGLSGHGCEDGGVCITLPTGGPASDAPSYELVTTQLTWPDAETSCESRTGANGKAGGHLVVFETTDEREELSRELAALTQAGLPELLYWVGLQNTGKSSVPAWTWLDGTPVDGAYPLEWGDGEPTAGTYAYGKVENVPESTTVDRQLLHAETGVMTTRPFVCEFAAP